MENEQVVETAATESTTTESSPEVGGQEVEAHTGEPVEHDAPERVEAEAGEDGGASDEPSYTLRVLAAPQYKLSAVSSYLRLLISAG